MSTRITLSARSTGFLARHGRLLALCGLSLLLHLALLAWIDARIAPPPAPGAAGLAVRLSEAQPAPSALHAPPVQPPGPSAPRPAPPASPAPAPDPAPAAAPVPPSLPLAAARPAPPAAAAAVEAPSRYRVSMPPSVTLVYEVRDTKGAVGEATLAWRTDGVQYRLEVDGIPGRIASEGATDDAGIAPLRATYAYGAGSAAVAFDRERRAIVFESLGRSAQDLPGSQDGATLLMQLSGIGLADPDQLQEAVDLYVGRADGAAVERYRVLGQERIATPLGSIDTLHLARQGGDGLEVWLAPARGWLPVQLRAAASDGSVRTQVVREIRDAPAG